MTEESGGVVHGTDEVRHGRALKLADRYRDGYRVGDALVSLGGVVKIFGYVLGAIAVIVAVVLFFLAAANGEIARGLGVSVVALFYAAIIVFFFFVYGSLISAVGQIVHGVLDGAVFNAPFLTDDERASLLGLD
jgi:hypothetical protein